VQYPIPEEIGPFSSQTTSIVVALTALSGSLPTTQSPGMRNKKIPDRQGETCGLSMAGVNATRKDLHHG
jgi:hypothetical protein